MKSTGSNRFFPIFFTLATLLLISTSVSRATASESEGNATLISEYIEGEEEGMFFGGSGAKQRILQGFFFSARYISYRSLEKPPVCNENIYGNCIQPINKNLRPCTIYQRCKRGA
ncbi:hypothetical protein COLO4_04719 [Corchorus olitorius]|uniref:Rapid ALkalinization Factor n=1 Tax=Corchorus olitorius TaxID=93759 RepID=A0A1R3KT42_9ROSI|nr:hypothetical protein COLO4_04719 [Corchorus olitorius]